MKLFHHVETSAFGVGRNSHMLAYLTEVVIPTFICICAFIIPFLLLSAQNGLEQLDTSTICMALCAEYLALEYAFVSFYPLLKRIHI